MHHPVIHHDLAAVGLPDALVPEADAHDRQFAGEVLDDIDRQACLARGAGAGGDEDALRFVGFDLFKGDLVVSMHQHVRLQLAQVLDEVECERIVVVEDENHRQAKYNSESAWPSGLQKVRRYSYSRLSPWAESGKSMSLFLFFGLAGSSYHLDGQAQKWRGKPASPIGQVSHPFI